MNATTWISRRVSKLLPAALAKDEAAAGAPVNPANPVKGAAGAPLRGPGSAPAPTRNEPSVHSPISRSKGRFHSASSASTMTK